MTSWYSLLACPQADVTIERIAALAATTGTEPVTVDFKEKADRRVADCVASMANASGGLVLVGITDTDRKIVGVKIETLAHVADMLATRLDPADWLPDMFEVEVGDSAPDRYVLVIRIRPGLAPRPVMVQRTGPGGDGIFWTPVRIPGGTRQATRAELAALFAEPGPGRVMLADGWEFDAPQLPTGPDGTPDPAIDMMFKTGLSVTPGPACPGRPLSATVITGLAAALDKSPLAETLFTLTGLHSAGLYNTSRRGRPNTSGPATLTWQIADGETSPFEITTRIVAPGQYGHSHVQKLTISIEITSRLTTWARSSYSPPPRHGYAVIEALRQATGGQLDMATGTVYPALRRLEAAGLITGSWSVVAGRRRREYRLTAAGVNALAGRRSHWRDFAAMISGALEGRPCPDPA